MNDLQKILDVVNYLMDKDQMGQTLKPNEYNDILPVVNYKIFRQKYGLPEQFRPGMPFTKENYEIVQQNTDSLRHFIVRKGGPNVLMAVDSNGRADLPSDYLHLSSIRFTNVTDSDCEVVSQHLRPIEILTDAEWGHRKSHSIMGPTRDNPFCVFYNDYIQFAPKSLGFVEFVYLRKPNTPVYAYSTNNTTFEIEYDITNSIQFEYGDEDINDIIYYILEMCGVNLRDKQAVQYAINKNVAE